MRSTRTRRLELLHLCALWTAPFVVVALGFDLIHAFPYGLMYDDGYFYAQIAYNLARLGESSFDGFNQTGGYHLPWGAALALVSGLVGAFTPEKSVHLYAFQVLFAALALHTARTHYPRLVDQFCAVVLVVMGSLLMETLLVACLLLAFARLETAAEVAGPKRLGLALVFAVPLVRIDAAFILAVYIALRTLDGERRASARLLWALVLGVLAQVALMLWLFGEPFSVSAGIKVAAAAPFSERIWQSLVGPEGIAVGYVMRSALFVLLTVVALGVCLANRSSAVNRRLLSLGAGAAAFSAGHLVSHLVPFWCYVPAYLVLWFALLRAEVVGPRLAAVRRVTVGLVTLLAVAFTAHKMQLHLANREISRGARDFVARIKDHVPEQGRIYQIDGSGFTGFFSERSVVNGDGLVNSYAYARRMREGRLGGILDEQGICYLITNRRPEADRLVDFAGLVVSSAEVDEVFRSATYGRFVTTDFVLYRRAASGCGTRTRSMSQSLDSNRRRLGASPSTSASRSRSTTSTREGRRRLLAIASAGEVDEG